MGREDDLAFDIMAFENIMPELIPKEVKKKDGDKK